MESESNRSVKSNIAESSDEALEEEIEHLKSLLLEHDSSISHKISEGAKPSLEEKKARSRIIRQINRTRRQLYQLKTGAQRKPTKRITFHVDEEDYAHLQALAQQESLSLSAYIRKQLFPDK